jgi:hypothetical protein
MNTTEFRIWAAWVAWVVVLNVAALSLYGTATAGPMPLVEFADNDLVVPSGESEKKMKLKLDYPAPADIEVTFTVSGNDGERLRGLPNGKVVIPKDATEVEVPLTSREGPATQTIVVKLTGARGAKLGGVQEQKIRVPGKEVLLANLTAPSEVKNEAGNVDVEVSLDREPGREVVVQYRTSGDRGAFGALDSGTVKLDPNQKTGKFTLAVTPVTAGGEKRLTIEIVAGSGYEPGNRARATLVLSAPPNKPTLTLFVDRPKLREGKDRGCVVTARMTPAAPAKIELEVAYSRGAEDDFKGLPKTLTIPAGKEVASFDLDLKERDDLPPSREHTLTFKVPQNVPVKGKNEVTVAVEPDDSEKDVLILVLTTKTFDQFRSKIKGELNGVLLTEKVKGATTYGQRLIGGHPIWVDQKGDWGMYRLNVNEWMLKKDQIIEYDAPAPAMCDKLIKARDEILKRAVQRHAKGVTTFVVFYKEGKDLEDTSMDPARDESRYGAMYFCWYGTTARRHAWLDKRFPLPGDVQVGQSVQYIEEKENNLKEKILALLLLHK